MRAGGANVTPQHITDISLCGLFLMDVAKKIDHEFGAHRSASHTTLDAYKDISKLAQHLLEKGVVHTDNSLRLDSQVAFSDPTESGLDKLCNTTWIKDTLKKVETDDLLEREEMGTVDASYELSDVV